MGMLLLFSSLYRSFCLSTSVPCIFILASIIWVSSNQSKFTCKWIMLLRICAACPFDPVQFPASVCSSPIQSPPILFMLQGRAVLDAVSAIIRTYNILCYEPDSKVHGANKGPIWVLSAPDGTHVGPMNFAIWGCIPKRTCLVLWLDIKITWNFHTVMLCYALWWSYLID